MILPQDNCCHEEDKDEGPYSSDEEDGTDVENVEEQNQTLRDQLRNWSLNHNIKQDALKDLLGILNDRIPDVLPKDPRTLLKTPQNVVLQIIGDGQLYWHNGLATCIQNLFANVDKSMDLSIIINMDGLPVYKSSRDEFWPILFRIHELPSVKPMVIGIYQGRGKPSNLSAFLSPFVDEMLEVGMNGIIVNGHKIRISIRCFVCDSPARAFIKGKTCFN